LPQPSPAVRESCSLVELNHFYDEQGHLVFDQIIFYDWSPADARHTVRAWRLVKSPDRVPYRDDFSRCWRVTWQDDFILRDVRAPAFRETWTQYDPELAEREILPKERRKELLPVESKRKLKTK
jgi:hypothetical protein